MIDEPVVTSRRLERSVESHAGWLVIAALTWGTTSSIVGRSAAIARRAAAASKRGCSVTRAPAASAGVVWMLRPPTWNIGSTVST